MPSSVLAQLIPGLVLTSVRAAVNVTTSFTGIGYDDSKLCTDISGLIKGEGYPFERHDVVTRDGYIIEMHRIPRGRAPCPEPCKREPIFVMTGLLADSASFVLDFPKQSLGYVLADNKYDVWLGNTRGNTYGKRHKRYSPKSRRFWNFSFHEHAKYDAPAQIDYILNVTKRKSLLYVGLSQGTLMFFTMMSEKPEYNDKVKAFAGLAPFNKLAHMIVPPLELAAPFAESFLRAANAAGQYEVLAQGSPFMPIARRFCSLITSRIVCSLIGDTLTNYGSRYINEDFADGLEKAIGMAHVVGLGAFHYNHVWVCTMDSRERKEKMVAAKELVIKGKGRPVIDPNVTEVGIHIHWLLNFVTDGEVRKTFEDCGTIFKISRKIWKSSSGNYEVETSTSAATIVLKEGTTQDELPDHASVSLYQVIVPVPGKPPRCLRCNQLGHIRRQRRAAWCRQCRSYGLGEAECVPTYAAKTRYHAEAARDNDLLDDGESTVHGTNTRPLNLPPAEPQESPSSTNTAQREAETESIPQESVADEMEKEKEQPNGEKEGSDVAPTASIGTDGTQKTDIYSPREKFPARRRKNRTEAARQRAQPL
ncbi:lysosomal acid lipase/cholesteryl ester hydrolase [Ixodes scapularis]